MSTTLGLATKDPNAMRLDVLRCPECKGRLEASDDGKAMVVCRGCARRYPTWRGKPVLLLSAQSLFDEPASDTGKPRRSTAERLFRRVIPPMGHNWSAATGYKRFIEQLRTPTAPAGESARRLVVVIGAGEGGIGTEVLRTAPDVDLVNLDISPNPTLDAIADAHCVPVPDGIVDGVVIQAVLEHVLQPQTVVAEIHRILKPGGLVYAETPFMQMVHERAYDYTRFTDLGHRYLFKDFSEVDSGMTAGPGVALLWAWCYFLRAFTRRRATAYVAMAIGRLTGFWLLWADNLLRDRPGAFDAASGFYFLGRRAQEPRDPRELVSAFRGL